MEAIEKRVEEFLERPFSSIAFVKPLCVCECQDCEKLSTVFHSLPCSCKLCNTCFTHHKDTWISVACGIHRRRFHSRRVKTTELKLDNVLQEEARCKNKALGCSWIAKLKELKNHEDDHCGYNKTNCPLMCGTELFLKDLAEHVSKGCIKRFLKCPYCNEDVRKSTEQTHQRSCTKFPEKCHYCTKEIERCKLTEHEESCEQRPISCKFRDLGCPGAGSSGNSVHRETVEYHKDLIIDSFKLLADVKKEQEEQREGIKDEIEILFDQSRKIIELANRTKELLEDTATVFRKSNCPERSTDIAPTEPPPPDVPDGPSCGGTHCSTPQSVENIQNATENAPVHDTQGPPQGSNTTPAPNENIRHSTQDEPPRDPQGLPQGNNATPAPNPALNTQGQSEGSNSTTAPNDDVRDSTQSLCTKNTQGPLQDNSATPPPNEAIRNSAQKPSTEETQGQLQGNNVTPSASEMQKVVKTRESKDEADNVRNSTQNQQPKEDNQRQLQSDSATSSPNESTINSKQDTPTQNTQQPQASNAAPSPKEAEQKMEKGDPNDESQCQNVK